MTSRVPLGAYVRGSSAWILWQVLHEPLRARIRQLEADPHVNRDVVRHLGGTAADLEEAALQYREVACSAADSAEQPWGGSDAGLENPPDRWVDTIQR